MSCQMQIARIHTSRDQEVEMEVALLTIIPHDPLAKILLPTLTTLNSTNLEIQVPKGGTIMIPLN